LTEHHIRDEPYFGEDYYDEDADDAEMSERSDPYDEVERLMKI
jgi:hypothetical protein